MEEDVRDMIYKEGRESGKMKDERNGKKRLDACYLTTFDKHCF